MLNRNTIHNSPESPLTLNSQQNRKSGLLVEYNVENQKSGHWFSNVSEFYQKLLINQMAIAVHKLHTPN